MRVRDRSGVGGWCLGVGWLAFWLVVGAGCTSRDNEEKVPEDVQKANEALKTAEDAMKKAGVDISFEDLGQLDNLREKLPDPGELKKEETRENLETAIDNFYAVFDATGVSLEPLELLPLERKAGAPAQIGEEGLSPSDRALVHIYLAYLFSLDAVSRLVAAGEDLFTVEYPKDLNSGQIYAFDFMKENDIKDLTPQEVLAKFFGASQRQALIDAVALLTGGEVEAEGMKPSLDKNRFRQSAFYHLGKAAETAGEISPEIKLAVEQFETTINLLLSQNILVQVEKWGFEVTKMPAELKKIVEEARKAQ